jgi:hypothetical protein
MTLNASTSSRSKEIKDPVPGMTPGGKKVDVLQKN